MQTVAAYAVKVRDQPINHGFHLPGARVEGLRTMEFTATLGRGRRRFRQARRQLLAWKMHHGSCRTAIWRTDQDTIVTVARMAPFLWVLNPCRCLSVVESHGLCQRSVMVAYATTRGHLIAGREQMQVRLCANGDVTFEVSSISQGAGFFGRALFPLLAPAQTRFFREQLRCMALGGF